LGRVVALPSPQRAPSLRSIHWFWTVLLEKISSLAACHREYVGTWSVSVLTVSPFISILHNLSRSWYILLSYALSCGRTGGVRFKNMCLDAFNLSKNKLICTYGKKKIIPFSVISFTIDNPFERFLSLSRY
jgi:hypothetical protein